MLDTQLTLKQARQEVSGDPTNLFPLRALNRLVDVSIASPGSPGSHHRKDRLETLVNCLPGPPPLLEEEQDGRVLHQST